MAHPNIKRIRSDYVQGIIRQIPKRDTGELAALLDALDKEMSLRADLGMRGFQR